MADERFSTSQVGFESSAPDWLAPALSDPYSFYEILRSPVPQYLPMLGMWAVTSFDAATRILADDHCVVFNPRQWQRGAATSETAGDVDVFSVLDEELSNQLMYKSGWEHERHRRLALQALMPGFLSRQAQAVTATVDRISTGALHPGMEVMSDLAEVVPKNVTADMLDVPAADRDLVFSWAEPIARGVDLLMTAEQASVTVDALRSARAYFGELVRKRRRSGGDDLLSTLVEVRDARGGTPTDDDLAVLSVQLLGAYETTMALIGNLVLALVQHPAECSLLRKTPRLPTCGSPPRVR